LVEISAHKLYEGYLVELEHVMGKDITYEDDINTICMQLFGDNWGGVFARDKMERIRQGPSGPAFRTRAGGALGTTGHTRSQ